MNVAAFDALLDRIDAEIALGPVPPRKIATSTTVSREDADTWRPRLEVPLHKVAAAAATPNGQAAFALQPSSIDLLGMGVTPDPDCCPPRPPEPPPATTPERSWLARLLFRRTR